QRQPNVRCQMQTATLCARCAGIGKKLIARYALTVGHILSHDQRIHTTRPMPHREASGALYGSFGCPSGGVQFGHRIHLFLFEKMKFV
ncbi:MAG: hypothetical protein SOX74_08590, partial [Candidatus Faecousia sp.]|uniref:hypothetical protein n=1 Tax=Faecousia sp. TaxID=2952921 RepID=UPI002A84FC3F|nr:hypothetical protein [Candidatus Faecousia sp.]